MYRIGARTTFRHHARAEEALQHSSLIATEELTVAQVAAMGLGRRCGGLSGDIITATPSPLVYYLSLIHI